MTDTYARPQTLEDIAEPVCAAHGVELVDVRQLRGRGGAVVQVIIDRERVGDDEPPGSGVSLSDCTAVSRDLSAALDVHEDIVPGSYRLEVSSPGIERPLVKRKDYERFEGREVRLRTRKPIDKRRNFQGTLVGVAGDSVRLSVEGREVTIPLADVARANLVHRFTR